MAFLVGLFGGDFFSYADRAFASISPFVQFLGQGSPCSGFAGLCLIGSWAYLKRSYSVILGLLVFGGVIEIAQFVTGWRFMQLGDFVADAVGIIVGRITFHLLQKRHNLI